MFVKRSSPIFYTIYYKRLLYYYLLLMYSLRIGEYADEMRSFNGMQKKVNLAPNSAESGNVG